MLRRSLPFLLLPLFSGCTLLSQQAHEQTLAAMTQLETNLQRSLDENRAAMEANSVQQNNRIEALEQELASLNQRLFHLQRTTVQLKEQTEASQQAQSSNQVPPAPRVELPAELKGKIIIGSKEWVWVDFAKQSYRARIDTGATTSSLNATDIQEFERDGATWIRFSLSHADDQGKPTIVEAPLVRWVKIKQASAEEVERRPVVEAWIRLGSVHEKAQFTLADRSHMEYAVLLGREFFKDIAIVDVSRQFVQPKPSEKAPAETK
ncbi:hypothetical protein VST7929_01046 [Vibrio stylophorae]|uniref:Retropepsin-like aspartic endopeptidase domain-containing protein n=1 Tax=Vibrio stylophorae TaxID=659351 RepID=A0ABN8DPS1_9VIBR|nr:ATP-dependent zinc protease [Vibrio stylophorae]CAH0533184.1 hypothetical protein VST7929_01046 [Vibrio stylophorae]